MTRMSVVPVTVALNRIVLLTRTVAVGGDTFTEMAGLARTVAAAEPLTVGITLADILGAISC